MSHHFNTRALLRADLPSIASILDATGLFPSALLPAMAEPFLSAMADHLWLVICDSDQVIGFAYCEPERMTDGTHNLLAIAVSPDRQRMGIGTMLVAATQRHLAGLPARILLVETSSLDEYAGTRAFYDQQAFCREAVIRDYYGDGEAKLVFWKRL